MAPVCVLRAGDAAAVAPRCNQKAVWLSMLLLLASTACCAAQQPPAATSKAAAPSKPPSAAPSSTPGAAAKQAATQQELDDLAFEAYTYLYPLVIMDLTRKVLLNTPAAPGGPPRGPNRFANMRAFPDAKDRTVVRPNFDTLYSLAQLDLTHGPVVVSSQGTDGRYYMLPMLDMWTDVFAVPGSRTTGAKAGAWAVVPPGWSGTLPPGVSRIDAPTLHVSIIGRTQTNSPSDYQNVHKIMDGYKVTPLSQWGKSGPAPATPAFKADPNLDMKTEPMVQVANMSPETFFDTAARLLKDNPPHITDWSQVERLKRLGIEPGKPFNTSKASPDVRAALARAPKPALAEMKRRLPTIAPVVNGWLMNTETMGVYGNAYEKRAVVALMGIGANPPEEAIYPIAVADAQGKPIESPNKYQIMFKTGELPPAGAFWSITMYDADGYQVANRLNRFALGDRDKLSFAPDGSLTFYIQPDPPGGDKDTNWLPTPPAGKLSITMRLYVPKAQVRDGRWAPPPIKRVA